MQKPAPPIAKKRFSQNFLKSPSWCQKIVDALLTGLPTENFQVWEIGPGLGALTKPLSQTSKFPLHLFEYDRDLIEGLKENFPFAQIHAGDFLKQDLENMPQEKILLVSNLPYHVSTPMFLRFLEIKTKIHRMVLTFQKEFANRLIAKTHTKDYGSLSVLAQLNFEIEALGVLPAALFHPKPKVDSKCLIFSPKPTPYNESLEKMTRACFEHRRKKAVSNLANYYPKEKIRAAFAELGLREETRAEEISPTIFTQIYEIIK